MREGWTTKKLKEVCQIGPPKKLAKENLNDNDLVSFVPMNILGIGKKFFQPEEEKELHTVASSYTYFQDGDVLLAKITPCFENGKLGLAKGLTNGIGFGSSEFIVYRSLNDLNSEYLYYFLNQQSFRDNGKSQMTGAVGHKRITKEFYENSLIPVPPLTEQKQIVAILDEAFTAIDQAKANIEKNIQNAKELFQSKLNDIFSQKGDGWEEKTLGEVYDIRDGTHDSPKYQKEGYPLLTSKNLKNNLINYDKVKYISEYDFISINKRSKVDLGDVLFAMIGTIGNPVVITEEPDYAIKNVALFKVPKNQNSLFLKYYLEFVTDKMISEAKGTTQRFVGLGYLRNFLINLPPLDQQLLVVSTLQTLEEKLLTIEGYYYDQKVSLEELKKSFLQKAFAGELSEKPLITV